MQQVLQIVSARSAFLLSVMAHGFVHGLLIYVPNSLVRVHVSLLGLLCSFSLCHLLVTAKAAHTSRYACALQV